LCSMILVLSGLTVSLLYFFRVDMGCYIDPVHFLVSCSSFLGLVLVSKLCNIVPDLKAARVQNYSRRRIFVNVLRALHRL
jgi:hypothetical protein